MVQLGADGVRDAEVPEPGSRLQEGEDPGGLAKGAELGEDVAAAVVLRDGTQTDEKALRAFVAEHVANFKVPRRIVVLKEIPKGATGKMQRIGLAEKLGLAG